jgi:hypothetical protein
MKRSLQCGSSNAGATRTGAGLEPDECRKARREEVHIPRNLCLDWREGCHERDQERLRAALKPRR